MNPGKQKFSHAHDLFGKYLVYDQKTDIQGIDLTRSDLYIEDRGIITRQNNIGQATRIVVMPASRLSCPGGFT